MKDNKNPFDEHIQSRLSDFESPVPMDLFDRLQAQRSGAVPSDAPLRERLEGYESAVPMNLFDRLQAQRGGALPSDAPLRDRLKEHESPVSDKIFDTILAERQRRNRRVWLWRSATAIAALWLLGIVLVQLKNKNTALETPKSDVGFGMSDVGKSQKSEIRNPKYTEGVSDVGLGMSDVGTSAKSGISNRVITESASNTEGVANSGFRMSDVGKSAKSAISNSLTTESGSNTEGVANSENRMSKNRTNPKSKTQNPKYTEGVSDVGFRVSDVGTSPTSDIRHPKSKDVGIVPTSDITHHTSKNNVSENQLTSLNRTIASVDLLNLKTPQFLTFANETRKNPCSNPDNGCPTFGMRRRGIGEKAFYVDAFVAPEYIVRSFIKNLPESEKLLVARDSVEKTQYAVSTGVRASFVLGNGLAIRAGAIYNQINEKARFDSLGIGTITTTYKVNSLPNGQLDTVSVIRIVTDGIFRKTRYNHYRTIDIPVQIGFEKNLKNGWGIGVNGGAIFNVTAWRKADIIGSDLRQLTVSSGINEPNPVFNTRIGVSLTGSVAVYRQFTDNLQFVVEPTFRYGLQPITRTDYALKQQYSTVGLIAGLRLKI